MQLDLTILTKIKKQPAIADRTHTVVKVLSTHVSIVLTQISIHTEDGSLQLATFTQSLKRVQYLRAQIIPIMGH
jgi:hypothetical protein